MTEGMPPELITTSARDQEMAAVLDRLTAMAGEGRLADGDVQAIRHLASRPKARRTVRCPVCALPDMFGTFTAETDADLFAMIANHVMASHKRRRHGRVLHRRESPAAHRRRLPQGRHGETVAIPIAAEGCLR